MATLDYLRMVLRQHIIESDVDFHPKDLARIDDDKYLWRVLQHCEHDLIKATDMLLQIFLWRKMVQANDINERNIIMPYIEEGMFFPSGRDVDNCLLFVIKFKKYLKDQEDFQDIKRVIIYWLDRFERQENGNRITLFLDFETCTLVNLDTDFIEYFLMLIKHYYPSFINYILIYQMPWSMGAAFKLTKALFPTFGMDKIKFVNRDGLTDYVNPDQASTALARPDGFQFHFEPERPDWPGRSAEQERESYNELFTLSPNETIYFNTSGNTGQFLITNIYESAISYSVRTTAPNKFKMRPNSGRLASGETQTVLITTQTGINSRRTVKDKIIVTARWSDPGELWHNTDKKDEHRLKCYFPEKLSLDDTIEDTETYELLDTRSMVDVLDVARYKHKSVISNFRGMRLCQILMFFAVLVGIIMTGATFFLTLAYCDSYCRSYVVIKRDDAMGHPDLNDPMNFTRMLTAFQFTAASVIMVAMLKKMDDWRNQSEE